MKKNQQKQQTIEEDLQGFHILELRDTDFNAVILM